MSFALITSPCSLMQAKEAITVMAGIRIDQLPIEACYSRYRFKGTSWRIVILYSFIAKWPRFVTKKLFELLAVISANNDIWIKTGKAGHGLDKARVYIHNHNRARKPSKKILGT